jgi:nitrogen fixation protein NifU and related proteins
MTLDMYQENVLDHHKRPRNKGRLDHPDMRAKERNPLCGDEIEVFVTLSPDEKVAEVKFDGQGCAISQAAISMLTGELQGKTLAEVEAMGPPEIQEMIGVPLSPVRLKCALLSIQTTHKALADYKLRKLTGTALQAEPAVHVHGPYCAH